MNDARQAFTGDDVHSSKLGLSKRFHILEFVRNNTYKMNLITLHRSKGLLAINLPHLLTRNFLIQSLVMRGLEGGRDVY
jgi:hypothetical protein